MKPRRLSICLTWIVLAGILAVGMLPTYFLLLERPYLSYRNLPFPVVAQPVRPGDTVSLNVARCNSDRIPHNYATTHSVQNLDTGVVLLLPDVEVMILPGCTIGESRINKLPDHLFPGRYRVYGMAEVRGTLRTHYIDWYSEPFTVLPERK